jgi:hypothetical protein
MVFVKINNKIRLFILSGGSLDSNKYLLAVKDGRDPQPEERAREGEEEARDALVHDLGKDLREKILRKLVQHVKDDRVHPERNLCQPEKCVIEAPSSI